MHQVAKVEKTCSWEDSGTKKHSGKQIDCVQRKQIDVSSKTKWSKNLQKNCH